MAAARPGLSPVGPLDGGSIRARHVLLPRGLLERPDLHPRAAGGRPLGGPFEGGVQVDDRDDPKPAQLLLGLGERPVGGDHLTALGANDRGRGGRVQAAGEHTQAPADWSSALKASTAWYVCCISASEGTGSPSTMWTASRYCFMSILP